MSKGYGGAYRDHEPRVWCRFCNKGFSSWNALAGHMKIHRNVSMVQSLEDNKQVELEDPLAPPKNGDHDLDENDGEGTSSCFVCNKSFRSLNALFGHMRCHPNRPWRGIHPPPRAKTTSGSSSTLSTKCKYTLVASGTNSCESFPYWITTRKRRQKRMMPADHVGRSSHNPNLSEKLGIEDSSQTEEAGNESSGLRKRQQILLEHEFDLGSTKERKMEEERHDKNIHGNLPHLEQLQEIGRKSTEKMNTGILDLDASLIHFTQICNKALLMDQLGLGSHKRTHWQGPTEAAFSQEESLGEASRSTGRRVLDFDLNDLPPMEE